MFHDLESLREIIGLCSSFLTIREDIVYFVQAGHVWVARYNYTTLGHGDGSSAADTRGPLTLPKVRSVAFSPDGRQIVSR